MFVGPAGEVVPVAYVGQATGSAGRSHAAVGPRSPVRVAVLSLVTASVYGFWWDVSCQLRVLGQPADPWPALAAVTIGWLAIVPPFLSVHRTDTMIADTQRRPGQAKTLSSSAPVAIAAVAAAGALVWFATAVAGLAVWFLIGVIWPLAAMVFVGYMQRELNRALGQRVPARP